MKQREIKQYKMYNKTYINNNCTNIKISIVEIRNHKAIFVFRTRNIEHLVALLSYTV